MRPPFSRVALAGLAALAFVAGCVSITGEPRALLMRDDGSVVVEGLACAPEVDDAAARRPSAAIRALDPAAIQLVTWNIHKQWDAGWEHDLRVFSAHNDVVLLQETVLDRPLREQIEGAGLRWVMASSFLYGGVDIGVLTASRVPPIASCTLRVVEPLLRLPKSAVVSWFALAGRTETLAVANVHAVNFSFSLDAYREQFQAIRATLRAHRGPLILAGDLNTWTAERSAVVRDVAKALGLHEVAFAIDRRSVFFGHQLDHIFTRDLAVEGASAISVTSSDHNPVAATLRVAP